jgi:YegS/Rv2252/BmrU family lipid kinase
MRHLFIINPTAGEHDVTRDITQRVDALSAEHQIICQIEVTRYAMHAAELVRKAAAQGGSWQIYACGGDGTLNEAVNGAYRFPNVAVTHVPCGTGNDFLRLFGSDAAKFKNLSQLIHGEYINIDTYSVAKRIGINIGSVGFDCRVAADMHRFKRLPIIGKKRAYIMSVIYNTIKGISTECQVCIDGQTYPGPFSLISVCNGSHYGGGLYIKPDAVPNDGLLDFMLIKPVSRFTVARLFKIYTRGGYRELPEYLTHMRGKRLDVLFPESGSINVDGEMISAQEFSFQINAVPLRFLVPKGVRLAADINSGSVDSLTAKLI